METKIADIPSSTTIATVNNRRLSIGMLRRCTRFRQLYWHKYRQSFHGTDTEIAAFLLKAMEGGAVDLNADVLVAMKACMDMAEKLRQDRLNAEQPSS